MSDHIRIDFERVAESVQFIENASDAIRSILDQLGSDLAFTERAWTGEAFEAYLAARRQWEAQMRETQRKLRAYAAVLERAGGTFAENERTLARSF